MHARERPWWLVALAIYVVSLVVFAAWAPHEITEFPLDDAWIHRVYARAFAAGQGFAFNDGEQATGFTSPLWVVITAPPQWLGGFGVAAVVVGVKLIGAALGGLAIVAVYRLAMRASERAWPALLAAGALACEPELAFAAMSGMEVTLLLALWLWLIVFVQEQRWRPAAVMLGLLPVARPEGLVLAAVVGVAVLIQQRRALRPLFSPWTLAWVLAPTASWIAYCLVVTGHPLPATYYVKAHGGLGAEAVPTAATLITAHGWGGSVVLVVLGLAGLAWWARRQPTLAVLAAGSLAFVLAVLVSRQFSLTGYYWTRWTEPGVLAFGAAWLLGLALGGHAVATARLAPAARRGLLGVAALAALAATPTFARSFAERASHFGSDARVIRRMNVDPGRWIAEHTPPDAVVGVNDAGGLRYFGERTTIDLVGLNNVDVAFRRVSWATIAERLDWLAAYPDVAKALAPLVRFRPMATFSVPLDEYTICSNCPGQTTMSVGPRARDKLTADQRAALIAALREQPATAWLATGQDPAAIALTEQLRSAFEEAGWRVASVERSTFAAPGVFLFAADKPWPPTVDLVRRALAAAELPVEFAAGYRGYLERNPKAPRFALAPDQAFVLAVGAP